MFYLNDHLLSLVRFVFVVFLEHPVIHTRLYHSTVYCRLLYPLIIRNFVLRVGDVNGITEMHRHDLMHTA